jgi:serine/threonine protein kinase
VDTTVPLPPPERRGVGDPAHLQSQLGNHYEIVREVGRGGMGVVYQGRHRSLGRPVALKVVLPGGSTDRFLREARLLASIRSPHVVNVYDYHPFPDGSAAIAMEWIDGRDLGRILRKSENGRIDEPTALQLMKETCRGMQAAADEGIIHRDLKPSNILIDGRGQARVVDFGLARGLLTTEVTLTEGTGLIMGTPLYMAPEQAEDPRGVDTRTDIYSFGATFYHALVGEPPFGGKSFLSILLSHKADPLVSPRARNQTISQRTNDVLERCLAKSPGDRFQSFTDVLGQLERSDSNPWDTWDDDLKAYLDQYHARRPTYLERRQEWNEPDLFTFPNGRVLKILRANLVDQQVDALVSSDDESLSMGGGVSQAILMAGGRRIREEAARYRPVRHGRAVVTSGGELPARFVFHGITLQLAGGEWKTPSRDIIAEIMTSCFYHADTLSVRTMAFPVLGTGAGRLSEEICLDTMFRYLVRTLLHGVTSVREARIVLFGVPRE